MLLQLFGRGRRLLLLFHNIWMFQHLLLLLSSGSRLRLLLLCLLGTGIAAYTGGIIGTTHHNAAALRELLLEWCGDVER